MGLQKDDGRPVKEIKMSKLRRTWAQKLVEGKSENELFVEWCTLKTKELETAFLLKTNSMNLSKEEDEAKVKLLLEEEESLKELEQSLWKRCSAHSSVLDQFSKLSKEVEELLEEESNL